MIVKRKLKKKTLGFKNIKLIKLLSKLRLRKKKGTFKLMSHLGLIKKFSKRKMRYTSKMRKIISKYKVARFEIKSALANRLENRLNIMSKLDYSLYVKRNYLKKSYFSKITKRSLRQKSIMKRSSRKKPTFSKKNLLDKRFLFKVRNSLVNSKKFLYRKQFPKIKGKKNRNFNFMYYNNIEKAPIKFHIGRIVISYFQNNTFINIHDSKKMLKVLSAGKLGFKGPKRSTPFSRQIVARKAVKFLLKTKLNVLDIYLNSNYNRWYYFLFKEFSKPKIKPYAIRYLISNNPRPHGFIRDKKHRRK